MIEPRPVLRGEPPGQASFETMADDVDVATAEPLEAARSERSPSGAARDEPVIPAPPGPAEPRPRLRPRPQPARTAVPRAAPATREQPGAPRDHEPAGRDRALAARDQLAGEGFAAAERVATAPQLRRFIKSRAYVPMHELRRRFAINGGEDEVTPVELDRSRIYVGLPEREGRLLGELLRGGDIGYELSLDPVSPIVVGVYPMRPVTRP
jgi:hypothetical protein